MTDIADAEFRQQGTDLPKGSADQLQEGIRLADLGTFGVGSVAAYPGGGAEPNLDPLMAEVFAPSDRPDVPVTEGMSFGPGANYSALPDESEDQFLNRVARRILSTGSPSEFLQEWAASRLVGK